jgi:hypothetical protein
VARAMQRYYHRAPFRERNLAMDVSLSNLSTLYLFSTGRSIFALQKIGA